MQKITLTFIFLFLLTFSAKAQTWQELDSIGRSFLQAQKFKEADSVLNQALVLIEQEVGKNDTLYTNVLNQLFESAYYQSKNEQAMDYAIQMMNITEKILGKEHPNYASACSNLAVSYQRKGLYAKAEPLHLESKNIYEKVVGKEHLDYATSCNDLAMLYLQQGLYAKSEPLIVEAKNIFEKVLGKEHPYYAGCCNNLAVLYYLQGLYAKTEPLMIESKNINEKVLGKEHPSYAQSCNNLADLYRTQGLYAKAEPLCIESKNIIEKVVGKDPNYAIFCRNLAELYRTQRLYDKAEPLYIESKNIIEKVLGKEHLQYAGSCNDLANLYLEQDLYAKAEPLHLEAKKIREKILGKENLEYANSCDNLAELYHYQGLYAKAEPLHLESKNIIEKVVGKEHPNYAISCNNLARLYQRQRLYDKAEPLYVEVITNKTQQISTLLPTLSEKERIAYLKSIELFFNGFQDFAIAYHKEKPQVIADLYNQTLFTKSLVFASTQKMREQILSSNDSLLITDFENWKKQKDTYNQLIQKSKKEQEKSGIDLTQLATDINELEKNLSKRSILFAENIQVQRYQWQQVKDKLGKNEAVVEIIRTQRTVGYDSLGENITETVYIALFVTPKTKNQPEMLVLENGSYLETELIFYQNAIEFKLEDEQSYTTFWKPIAEKLKTLNKKGFSKIYFSPDGVYHQISLNTLQNPENKQFLLEEQTIQLIGTSRDLIEVGTKQTDLSQKFENYKAYLLGYPTYNLDNQDEKQEGKDRSFSTMQRIVGQNVPVLPATKTEIETINILFNQKNITTKTFFEAEATEENVKGFVSPTILHIATHGFFIPAPEKKEAQSIEEAMLNKALENSFMRSGLLLASCENPKNEGEDGILTAEEAMNLSLDQTELVVLSACETGLGDIQNGEGVFGLQRAFQQAGAKTILMSLWKVSDDATQLLMTEFYKNLLAGKSKRTAFKAAQLTLKEKYPEPYYWGAFVMVGE